jgi:hypothetical protein
MSEHVLIPLPGLGTLSLPREVFEQHLVSPSTVPAVPSSELVDADELQARTGIPATWWMAQARERRVPFRKLGRYVRFDVAEIMSCDAYKRRALDNGGSQSL